MLIFNFHHVEPSPRHFDRRHLSITPSGLRWIIRTLRFLGYQSVSLADVVTAGGPQAMPSNTFALTFDDGYENNYLYAAPILHQEKCPATIFLLAGKFAGTNDWDQAHLPEHRRDRLLMRSQIQQMAMSPYITFGSHGLTHQRFSQLSEGELQNELLESYNILSEELGESFIPVLAYPWGDYDNKTISIVQKSPYVFALTTNTGACSSLVNPECVPRYSIYQRDGNPLVFLCKLVRHAIPLQHCVIRTQPSLHKQAIQY